VQSGEWLLREAVAQLAAWTAARPAGARDLHVSVNVSVRQLRNHALVDIVREVLADTGLPATLPRPWPDSTAACAPATSASG